MARFENKEIQRTYDRTHGAAAEKPEKFGEESEAESEGGVKPHEEAVKGLVAAHGAHASGAEKSAHIYGHADGTHHLHVHDHKAKTHEHSEHASHEEALKAAQEHLGGAPEHENLEDEAANKLEEAGHGSKAEALGVGYNG